MLNAGRKVFWKEVAVVAEGAGFLVRLDGRAVRTPAKAPLILPTEAVARVVAAEWLAQENEVRPTTMPITRIANSAIDKVAPQMAEVAAMLCAFAGHDLCCYRADGPAELVAEQAARWDPLLDWAAAEFDGRLNVTAGITHVDQPPAVIAAMADRVAGFSAFQLAAFHDLVTLPGSMVIGLAAARKPLPFTDLWDRAITDESWQERQWGADQLASHRAIARAEAFAIATEMFHRC